jgi:hypothetical protein
VQRHGICFIYNFPDAIIELVICFRAVFQLNEYSSLALSCSNLENGQS